MLSKYSPSFDESLIILKEEFIPFEFHVKKIIGRDAISNSILKNYGTIDYELFEGFDERILELLEIFNKIFSNLEDISESIKEHKIQISSLDFIKSRKVYFHGELGWLNYECTKLEKNFDKLFKIKMDSPYREAIDELNTFISKIEYFCTLLDNILLKYKLTENHKFIFLNGYQGEITNDENESVRISDLRPNEIRITSKLIYNTVESYFRINDNTNLLRLRRGSTQDRENFMKSLLTQAPGTYIGYEIFCNEMGLGNFGTTYAIPSDKKKIIRDTYKNLTNSLERNFRELSKEDINFCDISGGFRIKDI